MEQEKPALLIQGMHGLGDSIHQRAVVRQLMTTHRVWLETSWPTIYHDLAGPDLHLVKKSVSLRTQSKNAQREAELFSKQGIGGKHGTLRISYNGSDVMKTASYTVLEAMCIKAGVSYAEADFTLPVKSEWLERIVERLRVLGYDGSKRILVYRPLVARPEWRGSIARNANVMDYAYITGFLRNHYFVVSVADLVPSVEWIVGPELKPDAQFHNGELPVEELAALFKAADLVLTSSGFGAILAPAVGTPCISVIGGYEDSRAHDSGAKFAPYLCIEPLTPCRCWNSGCAMACTKEIDMLPAIDAIAKFVKVQHGIDILPLNGVVSSMFVARQAAAEVRRPAPIGPLSSRTALAELIKRQQAMGLRA